MRLRNLVDDDSAVSPVIGVILMVAITVILAAVIASFVLGLGGQTEVAPTADFSFNYEPGAGGGMDGLLTVTHSGGDTVLASELYIRGDSLEDTGNWLAVDSNAGASASIDGNSAVASGDSAGFDVNSDYTARIVWQSSAGDTSSELATDSGPDA